MKNSFKGCFLEEIFGLGGEKMAVSEISNQKTIQQIIDGTFANTSTRNTGELGKSDFLNLLVTQLRYQDPLKPVEDKEFIAQMAQFSSLEQMQNMNSSLSQSQAYNLIGKRVVANVVDEKTKETTVVEGNVTKVKVDRGNTYVVVKGKDIPIEQIAEVNDATGSSQSNISLYTNLIGSRVEGCVYDPDSGDVVSVNGAVKSIQKGVYEDYAVINNAEMEMSNVITDKPSTDPDFKGNYLRENKGKEVAIEVIDRQSGMKVPVSAILKDYSIGPDGRVSVTLDQLNVPVESISNVTSTSQQGISAYTDLIGYAVRGSVHDSKYLNIVGVDGDVKSVKAGLFEDFAVMDGVEVEIAGIDTITQSSEPSFKYDYLIAHQQQEVSVVIRDSASGNRVTVKGILQEGSIANVNGKLTATLDQVDVPVESITDVGPVQ